MDQMLHQLLRERERCDDVRCVYKRLDHVQKWQQKNDNNHLLNDDFMVICRFGSQMFFTIKRTE